jgi:enamine deaminase RidA (YjgF/YER057c/UK114 family)
VAATARHRDGSATERLAAYSRAARVAGLIAVSGTADAGADGRVGHPGDVEGQTRAALEKAIDAAERLGGGRESTLRTRLLLAPGADWRAAAAAHRAVFAGVDPASTVVYVAGFPLEGALVEVELDAVALDGGAA